MAAPGFSVKALASLFVAKDEKLGNINERTVYVGGTFNSSVTNENKCIYEIKITPKTVLNSLFSKTNREAKVSSKT